MTRSPFPAWLPLMIALLTCSGCVAAAVGADERPNATFVLLTPDAEGDPSPARGPQVLVPEPVTLAVLASQRVVVRVDRREVQYLADTRYADTLTKLTQFKLKRALESSRAIGAASLPGEGLAIDYQVLTDIRGFEIRTAPGSIAVASAGNAPTVVPSTAYVALTIKLLNDRSGNVVASRLFEGTAPVPVSTDEQLGAAYLAALDVALDGVLVDVRNWVARRI